MNRTHRLLVSLAALLLVAIGINVATAGGSITGYDLIATAQVQTPEIHGSAEVPLVDETPTVIATFTLADGEAAGGILTGTVHCTDDTDTQSLTTEVHWSAVRKASTVTAGGVKSSSTLESKAVSGGTLVTAGGTNGWTTTTTSSSISILLDANTSLTPTSFHFHFLSINNHDSEVTFP